MKSFFYACLLTLFVGSFFTNSCQAQFKQTLHRTFVLDNVNQVKLNLNTTNIEYRETKGSRVLVEMTISAEVPNETMMNFLIENGRYELVTQNDATTSTLVINAPKPANVIVIKGKECKEEVSYIVYLPSTIKFINNDKSSSSNRP
jgi:hypothetical protein